MSEKPYHDVLHAIYVTSPRCGRLYAKNDGEQGANLTSCSLVAKVPCPQCFLVVYCSDECRRAAWSAHKPECGTYQRLITARNDPNKSIDATVEFWGGYAAVDLINLAHNEGPQFQGRLRILLTGDFSLRHFIYSVNRLPPDAKLSFDLVICQPPGPHLLRTVFALALLLPERPEYTTSVGMHQHAEAAIHLLYSMNITPGMIGLVYRRLENRLRPCGTAAFKDLDPTALTPSRQQCVLLDANWRLVLDLHPGCFDYLLQHIGGEYTPAPEICRLRRVHDARTEAEGYSHAEGRMTQNRFAGFCKWRCDGMLLPYGAPRSHLSLPNPIFFQNDHRYPTGATSEPLSEWPAEEMIEDRFNDARNDVYGKMFYYVQRQFVDFQRNMLKLQGVNIEVNSIPILDIPQYMNRETISVGFDRIEIGDDFDEDPQLVLAVLSRILKHEYMNPCATALSLSRNFKRKPDLKLLWQPADGPVDDYAKPMSLEVANPGGLRQRQLGLLAFDDWEKIAESVLESESYFAFAGKERFPSVVFNEFMGIRRRFRPRIIHQPRPFRLVWDRRHDRPDMRDFKRWVGWVRPEIQLWLEWRKVADASEKEYLKWTTGYVEENQLGALIQGKTSSVRSVSSDTLDWEVRSSEQWVDAEQFFEEEDQKGSGGDIDFSWLRKESDKDDPKSPKDKKGKGRQKSHK